MSSAIKERREQEALSSGRLRQTSTMEDANALVLLATERLAISVRIGHVPVMAKPALMIAESMVSQPVEACAALSPSSLSFCL